MRIWGRKLEELFHSALHGLAFLLGPAVLQMARKGLSERQPIRIEAVDINSLLIEFLSEVVARSDTTGAVFPAVVFKKFGENFLEGEVLGVKVDGFEKYIKAVSYREVDIKKNPETALFETTLAFDV